MGQEGNEDKWTKRTRDDIGIVKFEKNPEAFCSVDSFGFVLR